MHVARLMGVSRMTDMILTGRVLDAAAAERAGLVQYRVSQGEAKAKAGELAVKVAGMARLTVLGVLQALPRIQDVSEADGLFIESLMCALSQTGREASARLGDFVAKRAAKVAPPFVASSAAISSASVVDPEPAPLGGLPMATVQELVSAEEER